LQEGQEMIGMNEAFRDRVASVHRISSRDRLRCGDDPGNLTYCGRSGRECWSLI
jgi:hypothetical protein